MPLKDPEARRAYLKAYRVRNKERLQAKQKEYDEKNKARRKAYIERNKERIQAQRKAYNERNKEKCAAYDKAYNERNKEKIAARMKEYYQTEQGRKNRCINRWKYIGVICDDWDALYEKYKNTTHCENCGVELTVDKRTTKTTRCLDHNHQTGLFRNVLCNACNVRRG